MSDPFLSEVRLMSFAFAPRGWAQCNGQLLPINQNQALFSLLGTTFGGDGRTTFALPDLRGRTPIGVGSGHALGERGGEPAHTLVSTEMPAHGHILSGTSTPGNTVVPGGNLLAASANQLYHAPDGSPTGLSQASVASVGGNQAHENMQPYLTLNYCIALQGIYPSQN
jgi:microcystin-dependent protein